MSDSLVKRHWRVVTIFLAITVDSLAIGMSGLIAYFLRQNFFQLQSVSSHRFLVVVVYSGVFLTGFAMILGVYRATFQTRSIAQYALAGKAYLLSVPVVLASWYFIQWDTLPRVFSTLFFIFVPVMFVLARTILTQFLLKMSALGYGIERTLLVDQGGEGPFIFRRFDVLPELGYDVVSVAFWDGDQIPSHDYRSVHVRRCTTSEDLRKLVLEYSIDRVVVTKTETPPEKMNDILQVCVETGAKLKMLSSASEELLRFVHVRDIAGITLYAHRRKRIELLKRMAKRVFDIFGSLIAIVLLSPLLILSIVLILLEDGLPVFYRQRRALVKSVKEFDILKFRTMVKDAELKQSDLYKENEATGGLFKLKNDPRLLKVGKILRKYSLDELPQLFNVLLGEMSLVGPRPLSIADLSNISHDNRLGGFYTLRSNAIPGMTGLWQISGRRELSFREMVLLDLYYIENQSVMFDLEILFATIPVVLFGKGGY